MKTSRPADCSKWLRLPTLAAALSWAAVMQAPAQVKVEIINDTGLPDSQMLFRVVGSNCSPVPGATNGTNAPMNPISDFTTQTETSASKATMLPLTTLSNTYYQAPYTIVSTDSGNSRPVYSVQMNFVSSGQLVFQYGGNPFVFTNGLTPSANPTAGAGSNSPFRFDYLEFTIQNTNNGGGADLTYVDKMGFPMKLEWMRGTNVITSSSSHLTTKGLIQAFQSLGLNPAVYGVGTNGNLVGGLAPSPASLQIGQSYTNFARIIAPYDIFADSCAFPYPTFAHYLNSLVANGSTYQMNGNSPHGSVYAGYNISMGTNETGWLVTMQYAGNAPSNNLTTLFGVPMYTNTITLPIPYNGASYQIAQSKGLPPYSVNGVPATNSPNQGIEEWMIGDVWTALNAGYWGGVSTNSLNWYLQAPVVPGPGPFGLARSTNGGTTNDGYYNLYCSLIFAHTDGYSYTYGERFTPNVLASPQNGDTLRVTLLPDERLNSPVVAVPTGTNVGSNSITLNWAAIPNATGYKISTIRPLNQPAINIPPAQSYTVTNLSPGLPYTFAVQATATNNSNAISSSYRPVSTSTLGPLGSTTNSGSLVLINVPLAGFNDPYYQISKIHFNGNDYFRTNGYLTNGLYPQVRVDSGSQAFPIAVFDTNSQVVFYDWLTFDIAPGVPVSGTNYSAISNIVMHGMAGGSGFPTANAFHSGTNTNFAIPTNSAVAAFNLPVNYDPNYPFRPSPPAVAGGSNNYANWIAQYYTSSPENFPESDPDGDTSSNVLEYFQARNPSNSDLVGSISSEFTANTNTNTFATNFGSLKYIFQRATAPNELVYSVSWAGILSTNMTTNWQSAGLNFASNAPGGPGYNFPTFLMNPVTNSNVFLNLDAILP